MENIEFEYGDKTVQELALLYENGQLNLEPGFQRRSVWSVRDRQKLILSILQGYPIPSVFLYERNDDGTLMYDVIDGKQRLESLFMFMRLHGFRGEAYAVRTRLDADAKVQDWDWRRTMKKGFGPNLLGYKIQTAEVSGELSDIIELFVRINSTGKALTSAEKRHAKYYTSPFLRTAGQLAERYRDYFRSQRILSRGQISRMKHVELISELMASIATGGLINKKTALDKIIGGAQIAPVQLKNTRSQLVRTLNLLRKMFPQLKTTRFANVADSYSLFMYVWALDQRRCILGNRRRNHFAFDLLKSLSNGVGIVREQQRKAQGAKPDQRLFADYLLTVQGDTDSLATRQRRQAVLDKLLGGLYEVKDERRIFSLEQRRLIWNSTADRRCQCCKRHLTWENFTLDHITPFSKGGSTKLTNAALMCKSCNSRKGARV